MRFSISRLPVVPGVPYPMILPPYNTVFGYFNSWNKAGLWEPIHQRWRDSVREPEGRPREPSIGIIESQSVKTVNTAKVETRGFDVYKATKGRNRHLLVDTLGLLLAIVVTAAKVTDRDGAISILVKIPESLPGLKVIRADQAYSGEEYTSNVQQTYHRQLEIVNRDPDVKGFQVLPSRWVVERTFGWLNHFRRLSKA